MNVWFQTATPGNADTCFETKSPQGSYTEAFGLAIKTGVNFTYVLYNDP